MKQPCSLSALSEDDEGGQSPTVSLLNQHCWILTFDSFCTVTV